MNDKCPKCGGTVTVLTASSVCDRCGDRQDTCHGGRILLPPDVRIAELEAAIAREKRAVEALLDPTPMCGDACRAWRMRFCFAPDHPQWDSDECRKRRRQAAYSVADKPPAPDNKKELTTVSDGGTVGGGGRR